MVCVLFVHRFAQIITDYLISKDIVIITDFSIFQFFNISKIKGGVPASLPPFPPAKLFFVIINNMIYKNCHI